MSSLIGRCQGSSSNFMNFLFDEVVQKVLVAWEYASAQERDRVFEELSAMEDRPKNVQVIKGNPEIILGLKAVSSN